MPFGFPPSEGSPALRCISQRHGIWGFHGLKQLKFRLFEKLLGFDSPLPDFRLLGLENLHWMETQKASHLPSTTNRKANNRLSGGLISNLRSNSPFTSLTSL